MLCIYLEPRNHILLVIEDVGWDKPCIEEVVWVHLFYLGDGVDRTEVLYNLVLPRSILYQSDIGLRSIGLCHQCQCPYIHILFCVFRWEFRQSCPTQSRHEAFIFSVSHNSIFYLIYNIPKHHRQTCYRKCPHWHLKATYLAS